MTDSPEKHIKQNSLLFVAESQLISGIDDDCTPFIRRLVLLLLQNPNGLKITDLLSLLYDFQLPYKVYLQTAGEVLCRLVLSGIVTCDMDQSSQRLWLDDENTILAMQAIWSDFRGPDYRTIQ